MTDEISFDPQVWAPLTVVSGKFMGLQPSTLYQAYSQARKSQPKGIVTLWPDSGHPVRATKFGGKVHLYVPDLIPNGMKHGKK